MRKAKNKYSRIFITICRIIIPILAIFLFSIKVNAIGNYGVNLNSSSYSSLNPYYISGFKGECTWYCWGRVHEKLGVSLPCTGYAYQWVSQATGWTAVDTTPSANSVMVDTSGGTGHVMFVEKIEGNIMYTTEANYIDWQTGIKHEYWEDRVNMNTMYRLDGKYTISGTMQYIHFAGHYNPPDNEKPRISNVKVTNVSSAGYTITCDVSDNVGVTQVKFPTWTEQNGQDDLIWHVGSFSNGKASFRVQTKDHKNEINCTYVTHIYAYDAAGNQAVVEQRVVVADSKLDRIVPDGDYFIAYAGTTNKGSLYRLDINGSAQPAATSTNVIIAGETDLNVPTSEIWTIKYSDGFYTICQKRKDGYTGSDLALDVAGASTASGANVMISTFHGGNNQLWSISKNGNNNGYRIKSKISGMSLDVQGGTCTTGTNVQVCDENSSVSQSWLLIPYKPSQPIENGKYIITSAIDKNFVMSIAGNESNYSPTSSSNISVPLNTNIQLGSVKSSNKYNEFELIKLQNGYYKIKHVASGYALDLQNGRSNYGENIALHTDNDSIAQQWAIISSGNGFYFTPACSGLILESGSSSATVGANIRQGAPNYSSAQLWNFVPAEYSIKYDMNGGSGSISTQKKYYKNDIILSTVVPKKEGYDFLGWSTDKNATTATYKSGSTYSSNSNVTLYAIWKKNTSAPITLTLNNKSNGVAISWNEVKGASKYRIFRKTKDGSWEKLTTTTSLKYTDKKAVYSETYWYSVRAMSSSGEFITDYGNGYKDKYLISAPKVSLANNEKGVEISWKTMSNAVKYRINRKDASGKWSKLAIVKSGTSFTDTTAEQGKSYSYAVVGMDSEGRLMNANEDGYSIVRNYEVVDFYIINTEDGPELHWDAFAGAVKYRVYRKDSSGKWVKLVNTTNTVYIDTDPVLNSYNTYAVRAIDANGKVFTEYGKGKTTAFMVLPTSVVASTKSSGVRIEWNSVIKAEKYQVYRKTKSTEWTKLKTTTGYAYTDKSAESGKTYYYSVIALDASGKAINDYGDGVKIKFVKPTNAETVIEEEIKITEDIGLPEAIEDTSEIKDEDVIEEESEIKDEEVIEEDSETKDEEIIEEDSEIKDEEILEDESKTKEEDVIEDETEVEEEIIEEKSETKEEIEEEVIKEDSETQEDKALFTDSETGEELVID